MNAQQEVHWRIPSDPRFRQWQCDNSVRPEWNERKKNLSQVTTELYRVHNLQHVVTVTCEFSEFPCDPLKKKEPAKNYYPEINTDHKRHTFIVAMQPHQYTIPLSRWTLLIYMKRVAWSSTLRYGNGTSSRLEKQGLQGLISQFTVTSLVPWHEFQTCAIRKVKTFLNRWVQFLKNNRIQLRQAPSFVVADL